LSGREKGVQERLPRKGSLVLVEFKAPRELIEEFDSKWRLRFSTRSEAIRFLLRAFVEESSKRSEYVVASVGEGV
jgi:metal-responsive CopG/Arc/MetJ family transcriptional regulator